jgi:hypothetical protein
MIRVRIPQPDTEEDVSAEQVVAYLLARGWAEQCPNPWRRFARPPWPRVVSVPRAGLFDASAQMEITIRDIARAEGRHPSAVLGDIVGPARAASVGAYCEPWLFVAELRVRLSCKLPACDLMGCSAARGAGESEAD